MIQLPAGLGPWASELAALPHELALMLAPWVGRLALAVGPLSEIRTVHSGEPDGYTGLARRGSYERLVTAEWGVADLFPDEFVRRAAAGEHLFLDLARRGPRGALRSVVLVSAGPAQLGAPRLAHLAALIVLARRARTAGASFSWGIVEDPDRRLTDGLDPDGIRRLLLARTARTADAGDLDVWAEALGSRAELDWWWIGAPGDVAAARRARATCLAVREVLDPNVRALDVEVHRGSAPTRLRLDLPRAELCARLLRDPFAGGAGARSARGSERPLTIHLAPGGRRLVVVDAGGHVDNWPIPNSMRDHLGKRRRWTVPDGHRLLAVGQAQRALLAATIPPDTRLAVDLHHAGSQGRIRVELPPAVATALARHAEDRQAGVIGSCGQYRPRAWRAADLVTAAAPGHYVKLEEMRLSPWIPQTKQATTLAGSTAWRGDVNVAALSIETQRLQWVEVHHEGTVRICGINPAGSSEHGSHTLTGMRAPVDTPASTPLAFIGFDPDYKSTRAPIAVRADDGAWHLVGYDAPPARVECPLPVVGVGRTKGTLALVVQPDPQRLAWFVDGGLVFLPPSPEPIASVVVSPYRPHIAWLTTTGEIVVYSTAENGILMRLSPGAEPTR